MSFLETIRHKLIVSCQATEVEPLRDSYIMSKMALAAAWGGAVAIRANGVEDIMAIKKEVDLPIIGIFKNKYPDFDVFITPTMKEVRAIMTSNPEVIAVDATKRPRPDGASLKDFISNIKKEFPHVLIMGDLSTAEEAIAAEEFGIDIIGTTLVGYTEYTKGMDPVTAIKDIYPKVSRPIIGEGNLDTPEKALAALQAGAFAIVVGGAITRPMDITKKFVSEISKFH
ncbi:MAG: N-acetylmannosamine-6-phosphate 2-epimerase [Brevinema sp.]